MINGLDIYYSKKVSEFGLKPISTNKKVSGSGLKPISTKVWIKTHFKRKRM